ncbi:MULTISPECIES: hypothetical protein [Aeribacillus]|jgi:surface carbohydrate biosynthesis protein|uniref:hypothetical protein n=1 Tax=Aeribacillus TaxID=1055323 RepID=UPI002E201569|nr:hypothetical protein [Aeribacillus composti]
MKKIDVLILIEHVVRELEMAVLLKYYLEQKGYTVEIKSTKFNKEELVFKYRPKILVTPWAYSDIEMNFFKAFNYFSKNKTIIFNLHQEQITNERNLMYMLPKGEAKNVYHLSWGKKFTQLLLENGCSDELIYELGNPRLDFYKKELLGFSISKRELAKMYNLDPQKKWCLVIGNGIHHLTQEDIDLFESRGVGYKRIYGPAVEAYNKLLEWIETYLAENKDYEFIYRPHPSYANKDLEDQRLSQLNKKYNSFKVIADYSLRDWIVNSDLSVSFFSTSAVESTVANKPHYLIRPQILSEDLEVSIFKNTTNKISSYTQFFSVLKSNNLELDPILLENINKEVNIVEGKLVTKQIADIISDFLSNEKKYIIGYKLNVFSFTKIFVKFVFKKMLYFAARKSSFIKSKIKNAKDIRWGYILKEGPDYFDDKDIIEIQKKIDSLPFL